MFGFRRQTLRAATVAAARPAMIEGLEDRRLLSASLTTTPPTGNPPPHPPGPVQPPQLHGAGGTVVSTTATTITVSRPVPGGTTTANTTYKVDPAAVITVDGKTATLASLTAGVKVALKLSPTDPTTVTAIDAIGTCVNGKVTAVGTSTLTLTDPKGVATTYTIPSTATITVDGKTAALSAITVGTQAQIQLSALDGKTVVAVRAQTAKPQPPPAPQQGVHGTIVSTTATTITVSSTPRGSTTATNTTYTLAAGATITADGKTVALSALKAGVQVDLKLIATDPTVVTAIRAEGAELEGKVSAVSATAGTLSVTLENATTATVYTIPASAIITFNGKPATLADITVGAHVEIQLSALDGTTILSVRAGTGPAPIGPGPGH